MVHPDSAQLLMPRGPSFEGLFRHLRLDGQERPNHTHMEINVKVGLINP